MQLLLTIFVIQISYVSLLSLRTIFLIKGRTYLASFIGTFEILIYVLGLSLVLENLNNPFNLVAYCLGFAVGIFVATFIERWMALGYLTIEIITTNLDSNITHYIRDKGFGATNWYASGREGQRQMINVLSKRKDQKQLFAYIKEIDPKAFVVSYEPISFQGGFLARKLKRF